MGIESKNQSTVYRKQDTSQTSSQNIPVKYHRAGTVKLSNQIPTRAVKLPSQISPRSQTSQSNTVPAVSTFYQYGLIWGDPPCTTCNIYLYSPPILNTQIYISSYQIRGSPQSNIPVKMTAPSQSSHSNPTQIPVKYHRAKSNLYPNIPIVSVFNIPCSLSSFPPALFPLAAASASARRLLALLPRELPPFCLYHNWA